MRALLPVVGLLLGLVGWRWMDWKEVKEPGSSERREGVCDEKLIRKGIEDRSRLLSTACRSGLWRRSGIRGGGARRLSSAVPVVSKVLGRSSLVAVLSPIYRMIITVNL